MAKIFTISLDVETDILKLESLCVSTKRALEDLISVGDKFKKNFWEYPRATKFVGIKEEDMEALISEQLKIGGTLTLQKLQSDANERKEYLEGINDSLSQLDSRLNKLEKIFNIVKEAK
jgi:Mg2+ and Co2+ transporter CorA